MRLLIIEDDRDAAEYLVKAFREAGHIADHAGDGEDGLQLGLDGDYDVLIVDRMLPKRDGLSVIGALREKSIETPVLILSALGQVDDRVKGLRSGGDDYLAKSSPARCCWKMSGIIISIRRQMSSTCTFRDCDLKSTRASRSRSSTRCAALAT